MVLHRMVEIQTIAQLSAHLGLRDLVAVDAEADIYGVTIDRGSDDVVAAGNGIFDI